MTLQRRGICPGVSRPLASGDGSLARWTPHEAIPIASFTDLCDLSARLGNGVMEITQRGSLQIRGLPPGPAFANAVDLLGIEIQENPPFLTAPSLAWERAESAAQAASALLRDALPALRRWTPTRPLAPKVSVLLDYAGSQLNLDQLSADVRLFVRDDAQVHIAISGNATHALPLGWIAATDAVSALFGLLESIAERGPTARASDLSNDQTHIQLAHTLRLSSGTAPARREAPEYLGAHLLPDGRVARGFAPAFGYARAETLKSFAMQAARHGAQALRPTPDRTLLAIGLEPAADQELMRLADSLGLIGNPRDSRRYILTCAGAPACSSARLSTRNWAPKIAAAAGGIVGPTSIIHLSGCTKGCAYPHPAAITFAGPDRLILNGRADGEPTRYTDIAAWINDLEHMSAT